MVHRQCQTACEIVCQFVAESSTAKKDLPTLSWVMRAYHRHHG
jgi:hypothetical protein